MPNPTLESTKGLTHEVWEVKNTDNKTIDISGPIQSAVPLSEEPDRLPIGVTFRFASKESAFGAALREGHSIVAEDGRRNPKVVITDLDTGKTEYHQV